MKKYQLSRSGYLRAAIDDIGRERALEIARRLPRCLREPIELQAGENLRMPELQRRLRLNYVTTSIRCGAAAEALREFHQEGNRK